MRLLTAATSPEGMLAPPRAPLMAPAAAWMPAGMAVSLPPLTVAKGSL